MLDQGEAGWLMLLYWVVSNGKLARNCVHLERFIDPISLQNWFLHESNIPVLSTQSIYTQSIIESGNFDKQIVLRSHSQVAPKHEHTILWSLRVCSRLGFEGFLEYFSSKSALMIHSFLEFICQSMVTVMNVTVLRSVQFSLDYKQNFTNF